MKKYRIRPCRENDLPKLVQLCQDHANFERVEYDSTGKENNLKRALFLPNPSLFCLVVDSGSTISGYVSYTFDYSTWDAAYFLYMDCLYLQAEFRNKGIGAEMINILIRIAQEHNCVNIQWQTPEFNEGAIRFYHKMGALSKSKERFTLSTSIM